MLMRPATPEQIAAWKQTWAEWHERLVSNRKSGEEVVAYLRTRYPLKMLNKAKYVRVVHESVLANNFLHEKLPTGAEPLPVVFLVKKEGAGADLYRGQDAVFRGSDILVGVDLASGYVHVEGSSQLHDELVAFQGLDEQDIENYFLVAQYVDCLERMGELK